VTQRGNLVEMLASMRGLAGSRPDGARPPSVAFDRWAKLELAFRLRRLSLSGFRVGQWSGNKPAPLSAAVNPLSMTLTVANVTTARGFDPTCRIRRQEFTPFLLACPVQTRKSNWRDCNSVAGDCSFIDKVASGSYIELCAPLVSKRSKIG
jgi:hypothetical protein